jgi:PKD repeat protein
VVAAGTTIYCVPNPTNGTTDGDFINGVVLGNISNVNSGSATGPLYSFINNQFTNLNLGTSYTLQVTAGTYATDHYAAWIDYNNNGIFENPAERLGLQQSATAGQVLNFAFTPPTSAVSGYRVMRVRCAYAATAMDACTDYAFGETEDYIVNLVATGVPPVAGFTSNTQAITTGGSVSFFDASTNLPTSWSWSFPGGTPSTSTLQNPTVSYSAAGCYNVTLTATNAFGSNTTSQTCYINVTGGSLYCTPVHQVACSTTDNINAVSISATTLNNSGTGCTGVNGLAYTIYPPTGNFTASLNRGQTYTFNVTSTTTSIISVWIDYNRNNVFETNEWTQVATNSTAGLPSVVNIPIPTNAVLGTTGMRVRSRLINNPNGAPDACTTFGSGETEDYTITIASPSQPPAASFTASSTSTCAGGCLSFTSTSTGNPTTYSWTFQGASTGSSTSASPSNICWANAGTYNVTLTVTNANGSSTATQAITVNAAPVAGAGADAAICLGGTGVQLNATSSVTGSTFSWSPTTGLSNPNISNPVANPTQTTSYTVTVTRNGCSSTDVVVVTVNSATANAGADQTTCGGGSVQLNATGNGSFSWSPATGLSNANISNPVANPNQTTTYTVTVTANGCTATDQVVVSVNALPVANAGSDAAICGGGSIQLNATSSLTGSTFTWSPTTGLSNPNINNPTASPTSTTTYTVTVTRNGCSSTDQVVVTVNNVTANAGANQAMCPGGSVQLSASGGNTYTWTPAAGLSNPNIANPTASPTSTTTYTVLVSANGCTATDQVVVTVSQVTANAGQDVSVCQGNSTQLNATGGASYSWSPATGLSNPNISNPVASPTSTTTYTVTVSNGNCSATDVVVVTVNPISANAGADQGICPGSSVQLNATGGTSYVWSPATGLNNPNINNPVATPTQTTTYTVTVTNGACSATDQVVITVTPLTVNAGQDASICSGSFTQLNATTSATNATYSWSPSAGLSATNIANPVAFPTLTTTYTVTVTSGACSAVDFVVVNVGSATANAGADQTICPGQTAQLNASGGGSYSWSPATGLSNPNIGNPIATPSATTQYTVTVTSGNCTASDVVVVNVDPINVSAGPDQTVCAGTATQLAGAAGSSTSFVWTPTTGLSNPTSLNPTVTVTTITTYTLTATNANCTVSDNVVIFTNNPPPTPTINFVGVDLVSSAAFGYQWFLNGNLIPGANNQSYFPSSNGNYTVTITNVNGCTSTSAPFAFVNVGLERVDAQSTFSVQPNPTSGQFVVSLETDRMEVMELEVVNLLGERLAHSTRSNFSGRLVQSFDLSAQPAGVYFVNLRSSQGNITRKVVKQ